MKVIGSKHPNGSNVEGTIIPQVELKKYNTTIRGKFQTSEKYKLSGVYNVHGTDLFLSLKQKQESHYLLTGIDFLQKIGSLNVKLKFPLIKTKSPIEMRLAGKAIIKDTHIGIEILSKKNEKIETTLTNSYLHYSSNNLDLILFYKDNESGRKFGFGYSQLFNNTYNTAFDITITRQIFIPRIRFAFNSKIDQFTRLKSRITQIGSEETRIGLAFKQKINNNIKCVLSTDFNFLKNCERIIAPTQYGLSIFLCD